MTGCIMIPWQLISGFCGVAFCIGLYRLMIFCKDPLKENEIIYGTLGGIVAAISFVVGCIYTAPYILPLLPCITVV